MRGAFAICVAASILLLGITAAAYAGRWDQVAAITLYPFWCWAVCGLLLSATANALRRTRGLLVLSALWVVGAIAFADTIESVFRITTRTEVANSFRVISLNCAGTEAAAYEILPFKPDIVLLQEVPGTNQVAILSRRLFGAEGCYVSGFDCAIVARCPLRVVRNKEAHHASAFVSLPNRKTALAVSVRFVPPETRSDLWDPAAWKAYTENRQQRLRQLNSVLESLPQSDSPRIIGGDFNASAGDAVFVRLAAAGHMDSFGKAGRGWGHTALNNIPIVRPDQIWGRGLDARSSRAVKTVYSDHRMVVADFKL